MKIALLNLPFDNNYGGNLQRYALVRTLQRLGHEVFHINLQYEYRLSWRYRYPIYLKRTFQKYFLRRDQVVFLEKKRNEELKQKNFNALIFYEKCIPHTALVYSKCEIKRIIEKEQFDAYIVGSDQVWREKMATMIGIKGYFLDFVDSNSSKRVAYAVSLGSKGEGYSDNVVDDLGALYSRFTAVSVREDFALNTLDDLGWSSPKPKLVLDPTLLLKGEDYSEVINRNENDLEVRNPYVFCYILDKPANFEDYISVYSKNRECEFIISTLADNDTIESWLSYIKNAKYVVTDSYHGCVFSILFQKPFVFLGNERRGNARVDSLLKLLHIDKNQTEDYDKDQVAERINELRDYSLSFLREALEGE